MYRKVSSLPTVLLTIGTECNADVPVRLLIEVITINQQYVSRCRIQQSSGTPGKTYKSRTEMSIRQRTDSMNLSGWKYCDSARTIIWMS